MQNQKQLYFIAIVCPEPLQTNITELKNYFFEKYNCTVALKSPAHITLISPFEWDVAKETQLISRIETFQCITPPFQLKVNGYGHFDKRTIFVKPEEQQQLNQLQLTLQEFLKLHIQHLKMHSGFHPHITIVNRDIKPDVFITEWNQFKEKKFVGEFNCNDFALLKLVERKWNVISKKNFS